MTQISTRTVLRAAMRWGVSGVVFLAVLEVCVRLEDHFRWNAPLLGGYSYDALFVTDSLGRHLRPGYTFQKWRINRYGFLGPEIERTPTPGVVRVAVIGSSEAFQSQGPDQSFPRQLERLLDEPPAVPVAAASSLDAETSLRTERNRRSTGFEVLNAGIPGMSVVRMEEYWNRWVSRFAPQVVVVYPNPVFYLASDSPADSAPAFEGEPAPVRDRIRLVARTEAVVDRLIPESVEAHLKRILIVGRVRSRHDAAWPWHDVPQARLDLYERHLASLLSTLDASGARVVVATHASSVERPLDRDDHITLVRWQRFQPRADPEVIIDFEARANEVTARLAAEHNAALVPLHALVPKDETHFSDHQHFTDVGAALVAEALAGTLRNGGLAAVGRNCGDCSGGGGVVEEGVGAVALR